MDGAQFADEIAMPIFGYFLKWADKSMGTSINYPGNLGFSKILRFGII